MPELKFDLTPLRDALAEYDRTEPRRLAAWESAQSVAAIDAAEAADVAAMRRVSEAFFVVTLGINTYADCQRVPLAYLRRFLDQNDRPDEERRKEGGLTVEELIARLRRCPPKARVFAYIDDAPRAIVGIDDFADGQRVDLAINFD